MTITPDLLTNAGDAALLIGPAAQPALVNLLIPEVSALITASCNRTHFLITNPGAVTTDYYSGHNEQWLALRQWPIYAPALTGTTTNGSPTVTGLTSTSGLSATTGLFVGQSVTGPNLPAGATILSIDSATQVTLTASATASGTGTLLFGIAVWEDDSALWGSAPGAFSATARLQEGGDYALRRDAPTGDGSKSALVCRQNDVWNGRYVRDTGMLSSYSAGGQGNIRVQACVGYPSVPQDLSLAAIRTIAKVINSRKYGQALQSEGLGQYNYALAQLSKVLMFGLLDDDVSPILAKYRIVQVGATTDLV